MKTYKYDTHVHTSEGSACSNSTGAEMADAHKAMGYDGIIITNHFFNGNTCIPQELPWEKKVNMFCEGYENAKKRGDEIGLTVLFGWELGGQWGSEFLTYGLDKQWLLEYPEIMNIEIWEYAKLVHESGGFIVHAHPFRDRPYVQKMTFIPGGIDGVECINMFNHPEENERARWFAESYGLPMTAGSDSHCTDDLPGGGIVTNTEIKTIEDYKNILMDYRDPLHNCPGIVKLLDGKDGIEFPPKDR